MGKSKAVTVLQANNPELPGAKNHIWWAARIIAVLATVVIGSYTLLEPFGRDQGIHATIAYALDEGLVTYRDVYNIKPPLTTAMHWISQQLFGHSMTAIRTLDLIVTALTACALVEIGRTLKKGAAFAFLAPIAFVTMYYSYGFWSHAQTDGWAGFLVVFAFWSMLAAWQRPAGVPRVSLMFLSGVLLGLAFGLKYTIGATGGLVFAPLIARALGATDARFRLTDLVANVLGGLAVLTAIFGTMALAGALAPFLEIQSFIRGYVGYVSQSPPDFLDEIFLPGQSSPHLEVLIGVMAIAALLEAYRSRRPLGVVAGLIWYAAAWLSGSIQGKGFSYHYLPLLPAHAFMIGLGAEALLARVSAGSIRRMVIAVLAAAIYLPSIAAQNGVLAAKLAQTPDPRASYYATFRASSDFDLNGTLAFAETIRARRAPEDKLFVWGYETMLYFLAESPPYYRYAYNWPFMVSYYDGRYTDDLLARLRSDPPAQFVVQKEDATPWVTYRAESSDQMLHEYPALETFLRDNYHLATSTPRFDRYEIN